MTGEKEENPKEILGQIQSMQLLTILGSQQVTEALLENASMALGTELCWQLHPSLFYIVMENENLKPFLRSKPFNLEV